MRSELLLTPARQGVERRICDFINAQDSFLSPRTAGSPRAAGDAIQDLLAAHLAELVGEEFCINYTSDFARRSMADMAFDDPAACHYIIDVKTHRLGAAFSMPNLTSVERLTRFYGADANYFVVLLISYDIKDTRVSAADVKFVPIEFLDWSCLTIGALGWGQIQIANASKVTINDSSSRKAWMLQLCERLLQFYPREAAKIEKRIDYFRKVQNSWKLRGD
jgi:hypothetical protein